MFEVKRPCVCCCSYMCAVVVGAMATKTVALDPSLCHSAIFPPVPEPRTSVTRENAFLQHLSDGICLSSSLPTSVEPRTPKATLSQSWDQKWFARRMRLPVSRDPYAATTSTETMRKKELEVLTRLKKENSIRC
ncbi:hypothetical protein F441_18311 [Phytophthora nicotianae CJ01A1]|uniref:RxLR effector protein n=3 Tax=Phytophthora nicotianae TaxID=4792 RepID=W2PNH2_PHYN3|nr:hypothetical protein PPTG_24039 [Phytophthora nicotianae INRA-310]ETN01585.1 hypothetical protein PPTG_24039 [Phytophthora nicotianae INRA-310]ETP05001.1 hypothetical protein F441_18311 [Phytophthora nicotianae CJ01A1]ETP33147.1 hypothetical protein F442_18266 [Phytophthora nicotianae P10297]